MICPPLEIWTVRVSVPEKLELPEASMLTRLTPGAPLLDKLPVTEMLPASACEMPLMFKVPAVTACPADIVIEPARLLLPVPVALAPPRLWLGS